MITARAKYEQTVSKWMNTKKFKQLTNDINNLILNESDDANIRYYIYTDTGYQTLTSKARCSSNYLCNQTLYLELSNYMVQGALRKYYSNLGYTCIISHNYRDYIEIVIEWYNQWICLTQEQLRK